MQLMDKTYPAILIILQSKENIALRTFSNVSYQIYRQNENAS